MSSDTLTGAERKDIQAPGGAPLLLLDIRDQRKYQQRRNTVSCISVECLHCMQDGEDHNIPVSRDGEERSKAPRVFREEGKGEKKF